MIEGKSLSSVETLPNDPQGGSFEAIPGLAVVDYCAEVELPSVAPSAAGTVNEETGKNLRPPFDRQIIRSAMALLCISLAFTVHTVSEFPIQTPISEELARRNPIAILLIFGILLIIVELSVATLRAGEHIEGWSLLPILPTLVAIAFTSPDSELHLNLFIGLAVYGFAWLGLFSYLDGNRAVVFLCGILGVVSIVFLIILATIGMLFPSTALSLSPLGILQKLLITLFAVYAGTKSV